MSHIVKSGGARLSLAFRVAAAVLGVMLLLVLVSAPMVRADQTHSGPISIIGDSSFTPANGVNGGGSGTQSDPYIIENWVIDASGANGIDIQNTTAYFVIRNCLVENGGANNTGIVLDNVINGIIESNTCRNNNRGISLSSSFYDNLSNNVCESNGYYWGYWHFGGYGIYLGSSSYDNLTNNTCESNGWGIYLGSSSYNTLTNNTCESNGGYGFFWRSTGYRGYGIYLGSSSYNTLTNNTCENNDYGIYLTSSNSNTISLNYFSNANNNAYDDGTNLWDLLGKGNYWSDWQPPAHPSTDGIVVDTPRPILGGTNQDSYPLVMTTIPPTFTPSGQTDWLPIGGVIVVIAVLIVIAAIFLYRRKPRGRMRGRRSPVRVGSDSKTLFINEVTWPKYFIYCSHLARFERSVF